MSGIGVYERVWPNPQSSQRSHAPIVALPGTFGKLFQAFSSMLDGAQEGGSVSPRLEGPV